MGRRKGTTKEAQQTLNSSHEIGEFDGGAEAKEKGGRFFACYLLTSLSPRFKGHSYVGFTVNPRRRIRQHNGEIGSGAWRTKKKRPWEMVLCIYGFPTNVSALQFEWAWQHPVESLAVRSAAASFKSLSGVANKIKLAYTMLSLPAWNSLNLVVNFFSTKYRNQTAGGCPILPQQMRTQICSMDELPCYSGSNTGSNDDLSSDEDLDPTDVLQESTKESIEAVRKAGDSPSSRSFEEIFQNRISEKDDTSHESSGCANENCLGIKNLMHSREEDLRYSSPPTGAESSFVTSFYNIVSYVEDDQIPASVEELDNNQLTTTFVACEDQLSINNKPCIPRKVEVIDIFTPSPCHMMVGSGSKKRKAVAYPEIIDLTKSPMFV
ncbi:uncharacterized protein [Henckelia pumila]|uniref:uncharacterized protein n=1 Tax=Henckelia pumila TaxID=405737 RepID=UPI003C6DF7D8